MTNGAPFGRRVGAPREATGAELAGPSTPSWPRPLPTVGDQSSPGQRAADPAAWRFSEEDREALARIVRARRDVRRFRPDPLDPELVERLLRAAHAAPSVGHSQPWRFLVLADPELRERAALIAERERQRQASQLDATSAAAMLDLKLEGIREAPLGIVVCCDRRVPPSGVLGRATFPDTDLWSCACAIENLWLTARAEGLGVGWVTLFPPAELAELLGLPDGVETLGWLCIGWPNERPPAPGLERAGWSSRQALEEVVLHGPWNGVGPDAPRSRLRAPGPVAVVAALDESETLLTPPGSLGVLDRALERLGALGITSPGGITLVLVAAEHPVTLHGVSTYQSSVTREVLQASIAGESLGAASARAAGVGLLVVDAGVSGLPLRGALPAPRCRSRGDLLRLDAMAGADVARLLDFGRELGADGISDPLVALGEVGIGNTTIASALTCVLLDLEVSASVGLGAGGDSLTVKTKRELLEGALGRARVTHKERLGDPKVALAALGGPEFAVLCGIVLGVAQRGGVVVLDGFATSVAALLAVRLAPGVAAHLVAGQRSREQAHGAVLAELGLEPLLDLRLRAGEGVGAVLASQMLRTALAARTLTARVEQSEPSPLKSQ